MVQVKGVLVIQVPAEARAVKIVLPKGAALSSSVVGPGEFLFEYVSSEEKAEWQGEVRVKYLTEEGDEGDRG